jgi:hypothetical protein
MPVKDSPITSSVVTRRTSDKSTLIAAFAQGSSGRKIAIQQSVSAKTAVTASAFRKCNGRVGRRGIWVRLQLATRDSGVPSAPQSGQCVASALPTRRSLSGRGHAAVLVICLCHVAISHSRRMSLLRSTFRLISRWNQISISRTTDHDRSDSSGGLSGGPLRAALPRTCRPSHRMALAACLAACRDQKPSPSAFTHPPLPAVS